MMEDSKETQLDKFKRVAQEIETDDSEERFDRVLRRIVNEKSNGKSKPSQALKSKSVLGD